VACGANREVAGNCIFVARVVQGKVERAEGPISRIEESNHPSVASPEEVAFTCIHYMGWGGLFIEILEYLEIRSEKAQLRFQ
jgi:hypothetical protein